MIAIYALRMCENEGVRRMVHVARIDGGAGCGKTTRLLDTMARHIQDYDRDMHEIAFITFMRSARRDASKRAAERFEVDPKYLEEYGWFRTLHSICYRQLNAGKSLLADNKDDREWLKNVLQEDVTAIPDAEGEDGAESPLLETSGKASTALALWNASRNRLEPFRAIHERAAYCDERTPSYAECEAVIQRYEDAKKMEHRVDFTDLLGRFGGWEFTLDGPNKVEPFGDVPVIPVWFIDEAQDHSRLSFSCIERCIEPAEFAYFVGDRYQSILGWSGASHRNFTDYPVAEKNQHVLPKSHRCPPEVLALGERILSECSDYWDRGIQPADRKGFVDSVLFEDGWTEKINEYDPSWLLIARTNFHARRIAKKLDEHSIPWVPTRGMGGWNAPARNTALSAMLWLQKGYPVSLEQWQAVVKLLPAKLDGTELFVRGAKTQAAKWSSEHLLDLQDLTEFGATENMLSCISDGRWRDFHEFAPKFCAAVDRFDVDDFSEWMIRVGTIHSAKGAEADNVLLLNTSTHQVARAAESQEGADEERRVGYVAVTRARKRLIVAKEVCRHSLGVPV